MSNSTPRYYWQTRPSDHRAGMRGYWHGRLEPMPERTGLFAKLLGRGK